MRLLPLFSEGLVESGEHALVHGHLAVSIFSLLTLKNDANRESLEEQLK